MYVMFVESPLLESVGNPVVGVDEAVVVVGGDVDGEVEESGVEAVNGVVEVVVDGRGSDVVVGPSPTAERTSTDESCIVTKPGLSTCGISLETSVTPFLHINPLNDESTRRMVWINHVTEK